MRTRSRPQGATNADAGGSRQQAAGFVAADGGQVDSEVAAGTVVSTSPEPGTQLSSGDTVTYYTSTGTAESGNGGKGKGRGKGRG